MSQTLRVGVLILALAALLTLLTMVGPVSPDLIAQGESESEFSFWLKAAVPYLIVMLMGLFVGLAELISTFPNYPVEAITSPWGLVLMGINGTTSAIAFAIARFYYPAEGRLFLLVIAVGVGFQSIIRTRFVLAKELGPGGTDLSLNLGWLYEQLQKLCKTQIDLALMRNRETAVRRLITRYADEKALYNLAYYTIKARGTLTPEEERAALDELDKTIGQTTLPSDIVRTTLALMILEIGGQSFADILCGLGECKVDSTAETVMESSDREALVSRLVAAYDLKGLVELALRVVEQAPMGDNREALRGFVVGTQNDTEAIEPFRKTVLARFVVEKGGMAFAAETLKTAPPAAPPVS